MSKITIDLPDEIVARLDELARQNACRETSRRGKDARAKLVREAIEQYLSRIGEDDLRARSKKAHKMFLGALRKRYPHLARLRTKKERIAEFERLSEKVRSGILAGEAPFSTVEEAMEWLRGKPGSP
jgi:metal-responsive CopG/Arc/MetJ family transcriptional regulator